MNPRPKPRKFMVAVLASGVGASLAVEACSSNGLPGAPVVIGDVATCIDGSASCPRDGGADVGPGLGVPPATVDGGDAGSKDAGADAGDASDAADRG